MAPERRKVLWRGKHPTAFLWSRTMIVGAGDVDRSMIPEGTNEASSTTANAGPGTLLI